MGQCAGYFCEGSKMDVNIDDGKAELILKLNELIDHKLPQNDAALIKQFLAQYYLGVSQYDLNEKGLDELYGALIAQWHFIYQRMPGASKIHVYNPQLEQHGWQSTHTIIEIVHENKPFLLDSIRLTLHRLDINVRLIIHAEGIRFTRDASGKITQVLPLDLAGKHHNDKTYGTQETPIYIEIDKQSDSAKLAEIEQALNCVLQDVDVMVRDWSKMLAKLADTITWLEKLGAQAQQKNLNELILFMRWLEDNHFTFLGIAEYNIVYQNNKPISMDYVPNSGLGVLSSATPQSLNRNFDQMYPDARKAILDSNMLLLGKTDTISTVHRPVYSDFIGVKIIDESGKLTKMIRFIGLYTSSVYNQSVEHIPYIRQKIGNVFNLASFPKSSHDGKSLLHIIETLPRDEIFQARDEDLFNFATGILHLQERQRIRFFIRRDVYGRYFSCLVFVPREIFTSAMRNKMQEILLQSLAGESVTFDTSFSESVLARIHFIIRISPLKQIAYDTRIIESRLIEAGRTWDDDLFDVLSEHFGEEKTNELYKYYADAFPLSYQELFSAQVAVVDIEHMETLKQASEDYLEMSLYRPIEDSLDSFRFKLFRANKTIPLSDIVPILEKMGLRIISERPHEIKLSNNGIIWINDYRMVHPKGENLAPEVVKENFQEAFDAVWHGKSENDGLNRLVLSARLNWRDIAIFRAYYRYLWQTGLAFSQNYVEDALCNNAQIAMRLVKYFYIKFDPQQDITNRADKLAEIKQQVQNDLDNVTSLNEDRIIRSFLGTLEATVRTNFFQQTADGKPKEYLSFKLDSDKVPDLPLPKPVCEIFVYTPKVEGIHLRGDRVARGGIRWSDRREDFRTEVLGLMKAQQVKNAVIVPLGAKGGFVVKRDLQTINNRDERTQVVVECYKTLMRGLLDLTDNYQGNKIIRPLKTLCWDQEDPYLVVAADKGTATFSDIANSISKEYNFWLGDAFASGGSAGYDHKKMAITARGAWESVKMHFQRLNIDVSKQVFTAIGIGDMAGDVFGNGALLSDKMQLIGAFNHMHIFFDPNPDAASSFTERQRLFNLPGSAWSDYNPALISEGGGVFLRSAKKIPLSAQMQQVLNTQADTMEPNDLIRAILTLKVDLFFNGGIGTFVKAIAQRNIDVGDRFNDAIRINGADLNARVVCEGGNLGFTQLARIEYAKKGGIINTDAIDNSGGVNCSDNEVNIKILLNELVSAGDLTEKQRNVLLASMGNEVADLVLDNNRKQNEALALTDFQAADNLQMYYRLQIELERDVGLDPAVEYLPNIEEINARIAARQGYTRPEIAVLMAYAKNQLKKTLQDSAIPDAHYVERGFINYFPKPLHDAKFTNYVKQHRLKRAIIATQIANYIVNEMGITFMQRLAEESGADSPSIARAYMITREVFNVQKVLSAIRNLGCDVPLEVQINMWQDLNRLIRRATRWFVRNVPADMEIEAVINLYKPKIELIQDQIIQVITGVLLDEVNQHIKQLAAVGVPKELAKIVAAFYPMFVSLDIVEAAIKHSLNIQEVAKTYFAIGVELELGWFGELIKKQPVRNYWEALARAAFRDDVDKQQRNLTVHILQNTKRSKVDISARIQQWLEQNKPLLERWEFFLGELKISEPGFTMFAVALRELLDLSHNIAMNTGDVAEPK